MEERRATRRLIQFFAAAYAVSWLVWAPLVAQTRGWTDRQLPVELFIAIGAFGPSLCGILFSFLDEGRPGLRELASRFAWRRDGWPWYLVAVLLTPAIMTATAVIDELFGARGPTLLLRWTFLLNPLLFLGGALNEEIGWRGYALPRLLRLASPLRASLILGVFWALWHAPLFLVRGSSQFEGSPIPYAIIVAGFSVLMTAVHLGTRGSLLAAVLFHASINSTIGMWSFENASLGEMIARVLWVLVPAVVVFRQPARWLARPGAPATAAETIPVAV